MSGLKDIFRRESEVNSPEAQRVMANRRKEEAYRLSQEQEKIRQQKVARRKEQLREQEERITAAGKQAEAEHQYSGVYYSLQQIAERKGIFQKTDQWGGYDGLPKEYPGEAFGRVRWGEKWRGKSGETGRYESSGNETQGIDYRYEYIQEQDAYEVEVRTNAQGEQRVNGMTVAKGDKVGMDQALGKAYSNPPIVRRKVRFWGSK